MITTDGTINLKRAFNVDVATLYRAWSDPNILTVWWKDLTLAEADFRTGGAFKFVWTDGPENAVFGTYVDIQPNACIAFSWSWKDSAGHQTDTLVKLKFASAGPNRSQLELVHELSPTEQMQDGHHQGWTSALLNLDEHFNAKTRPVVTGLEARVSRTINFPIERVFEAWTKPEIVALWFNGRQATRGKAGGKAEVGRHMFMDYQSDKGDVYRVYCEYKEIVPNKKVVFLWATDPCGIDYCIDRQHESRVTVLFTPIGNTTKVEVIHDQLTSETAMKDYFDGWTDCLASIEDRLTRLDRGVAGMKFSSHLDVKVSDPKAAGDFYVQYLGWVRVTSDCSEHAFKFGPLTIFLSPSDGAVRSNVHFEASTAGDIETLRKTLEGAGCSAAKSSMKNAYMFRDPHGNNIHVYSTKA